MAQQNGVHQPTPLSVPNFDARLKMFADHIETVVKPGANGRALFPEFKLVQDVARKIQDAMLAYQDYDMASATTLLFDAERHFRNCQVAYARGLSKDLEGELSDIKKSVIPCTEETLNELTASVTKYLGLVTPPNYFDPKAASTLYWATIDIIEKAHGEIEAEKKARLAAQQEQEKKRRADAQKQERERRTNVANGVLNRLSALSGTHT